MEHPSDSRRDESYVLEAQKSLMESGAKLNTIAFNYAMEVNKALFEIGQNTIRDCAGLQQHLFHWPSPEDFITTQAEMAEKTAKGCKEGFDRIANVSSEIGRKATEAVQEVKESIRNVASQSSGSQQQGQGRQR